MRRPRLIWQLFLPFLFIILSCVILVSWYASHSLRQFYLKQTRLSLTARDNWLS